MFEIGQKYKSEKIDVIQLLVKLVMNSLNGEQIRKENYQSKSETWMMTEYDERILDYQKFIYGNYIVKMKDSKGLQDEVKKFNTMPLRLGSFILSNSKWIMIIFILAIGGFYTNDVYYTDTDSLYTENKERDTIDKAGLVGKSRLQCKIDHKEEGIFYGLFIAPKTKYWLTINKLGVMDEHKTFESFTNVSDNLDRKEYFSMIDGGKIAAKVLLSLKKSFSHGVVIPQKMKSCGICKIDSLCDIVIS